MLLFIPHTVSESEPGKSERGTERKNKKKGERGGGEGGGGEVMSAKMLMLFLIRGGEANGT